MALKAMRDDSDERKRRTLFVLLGATAALIIISLFVVLTRH
ncbi:MAG: hypothetical protein ACREQB_10430 [Candidatus Binataceae bacterium]